MASVFLSHSSADGELARQLCAFLEARSVPCWIAPRDIPTGRPYAAAILDGIENSESLLLLATNTALSSQNVLNEVEQAHKRRKRILTVIVPPAVVRGEMDFYICRLQWLQAGGKNMEEVAAEVASVLNGRRPWSEVASPPSLRRTMQFRPAAFARSLLASISGIVLVLGLAALTLNRLLDLDYRRLGYVELATGDNGGYEGVGRARVWLLAQKVSFEDVRLTVSTQSLSGAVSSQTISQWPVPERTLSEEEVSVRVASDVAQLWTCLTMQNPGSNAPYRVTQKFAVSRNAGRAQAVEIGAKRVSREAGQRCGP